MSLPPSLPVPAAIQTVLWIRKPTQFMRFCQRKYGSAFTLKFLPLQISLFSHPDAVRTIFAAKPPDMHAGGVNRLLRVVVGESSVLLLDGDEHLRHRKLLMPSFHGERMRFYGETMASITRSVMDSWPEGQAFSLHPHTQEITLQIILRTVFGADEGAQLHRLRDQIVRLLSVAEYRAAFPIMIYLSRRPELENQLPWSWLLRERAKTDAMLYKQIAERRADPRSAARKDVLAMLMEARDDAGEAMTDRELRDELVTALAAGHETTATALAWAFERILSTPAVYERLREEIRSAGGEQAGPDKLAALPYLDATIKEVLRMRPVVPIVGRILQKDTNIGGYDLPNGSAVGACIYLAHRNPEVYPEPEVFRPDRFIETPPDPVSWFPFGGGIRRCIGAQFASYEMKIVLGTMLAAYDFELAQKTPARTRRRAVTLWPEGGARVMVRRRTARAA